MSIKDIEKYWKSRILLCAMRIYENDEKTKHCVVKKDDTKSECRVVSQLLQVQICSSIQPQKNITFCYQIKWKYSLVSRLFKLKKGFQKTSFHWKKQTIKKNENPFKNVCSKRICVKTIFRHSFWHLCYSKITFTNTHCVPKVISIARMSCDSKCAHLRSKKSLMPPQLPLSFFHFSSLSYSI